MGLALDLDRTFHPIKFLSLFSIPSDRVRDHLRREPSWNCIRKSGKRLSSWRAREGLSTSGLARKAGLDPTTFNRSKRRFSGWPEPVAEH